MSQDEKYILQTLHLAKKGFGSTCPNPMVGTIIVKDNKIIGKGYHKKFGLDHAEIVALKNVSQNPQGATLYTNLEPCSHYGKTPPCVDAIIQSGIKRVVCATVDPNPLVRKKGIEKLQKAGVDVTVGILEKEAREINEKFFIFHEKKRPFIAIKFASSMDGKLSTDTGDSKWITNDTARLFARKLRDEYQAILVGINTIINDDPHLGTRIINAKEPIRIVLDSTLKIPLTAQVLRDQNCIVVTAKNASLEKIKKLESRGITILKLKKTHIEINDVLDKLKEKNIVSVLVEGGKKVIESFINSGSIDKVYAYYAPILIGGNKKVADALKLGNISYKHFGDNLLTIGSINI